MACNSVLSINFSIKGVLTQVKMRKRSQAHTGRVSTSKRLKEQEPQDPKYVFNPHVPRKVKYRLANTSTDKNSLDQALQGSSSHRTTPVQLKLTISNHTNQLTNEDFFDEHLDELDQRFMEWIPQLLTPDHASLNYLEICNAAETVAKSDSAIAGDLRHRIWHSHLYSHILQVITTAAGSAISARNGGNDNGAGLRLITAHKEVYATLQRLASLISSIHPECVSTGLRHLDTVFHNVKAYPVIINFAASMAVLAMEKGPEEHIELMRYAINIVWRSKNVSPAEIAEAITRAFVDHVCVASKLWHKRRPWKNDETGRNQMTQFIEQLSPTFSFVHETILNATKSRRFANNISDSVSQCIFDRVGDDLTESIIWVISIQDKDMMGLISKIPGTHFRPIQAVKRYATIELVRVVKTCKTIEEMIKSMHEIRTKMRTFANWVMPGSEVAGEFIEREWIIDEIPAIRGRNMPLDLVKYFDRICRRPLSSKRLEEDLSLGLTLFHSFDLKNQEETMNLYSDSLTNRLLTAKVDVWKEERVLGFLIQYEKSSQSKVKSLNVTMQTKLKDMKRSAELLKDYVNGKKESKGPFSSKILTSTVWPGTREKTAPTMILPPEIQRLRDQFEEFYVSKYEKRHLNWDTGYDLVVIQGHFGKERKELYVNGFQACIILLFNEDLEEEKDACDSAAELKIKEPIELTYGQISAACGMAKRELNAALHSLVQGRVSILGIKRAGDRPILPNKIEEYADADLFQVLDKINTAAAGKKGSARGVEMLKLTGYRNTARDPAAAEDKSKTQEKAKNKTAKEIRREELLEVTLKSLERCHHMKYDELFQNVSKAMNLWSVDKKVRITHREFKELLAEMTGRQLGPDGLYLCRRRDYTPRCRLTDIYFVREFPDSNDEYSDHVEEEEEEAHDDDSDADFYY